MSRCCERLARGTNSGSTAIPPKRISNSRRLMRAPALGKAVVPAHTNILEGASEWVMQCWAMSALGPKADILEGLCDVRFTPKSGHRLSELRCPLCARSGLLRCNKHVERYSITSSARAINLSGMVSSSVFAVPRLITSSNLVGCSTGRSAGFSPSKIRLT